MSTHGILSLTPLLLAAPAIAQNEILIAAGDFLPGVGTVADVARVAVADNGHWAAAVWIESTTPASQALILDGQVLIGPGDPLPGLPGASFRSAGALDLSADGTLTWIANKDLPTSVTGSAVYAGLTPLATVGQVPTGPGLEGAGAWKQFVDARQDGSGGIVILGKFPQPGQTSILDEAIVRISSMSGSSPVDLILAEGHPHPISGSSLYKFASTAERSIAASSDSVLYQVQDAPAGLFLDETTVATKGGPSPLFGLDWISFQKCSLDMNSSGQFAYAGRADGTVDIEQLLVLGQSLVARTGASIDAIAPHVFEDLAQATPQYAPVVLDDTGRLFWYGDWSDPDTSQDQGLFRDQVLIVREGASMVEGLLLTELVPDAASSEGRPTFDATEDGEALITRARLSDGRICAVRIVLDASVESIQGCSGNTAILNSFEPKLGTEVTAYLEDAQSDDGISFVALSTAQAAAGSACGVQVAGLGETLVDLSAGALLQLTPPLFQVPTVFDVFSLGVIPDQVSLIGVDLYAQAASFDLTGSSSPYEPVRLSNGLKLVIGF